MSTRRCAELVRIWPNGSDAGRGGGAGRGRSFVRLRWPGPPDPDVSAIGGRHPGALRARL